MTYLVRKINKRNKLDELLNVEDVNTMNADIATTEFKTINGTLSTWIIDSLENIDEAVLAIVTTSSSISKMDFMIIDTAILDDNDLIYKQTDPGVIVPVNNLQNKHYDIQDISVAKLANCSKVFKQVVEQNDRDGNLIIRYVEREILDLLEKAYNQSRIDLSILNNGIKKKLDFIGENNRAI